VLLIHANAKFGPATDGVSGGNMTFDVTIHTEGHRSASTAHVNIRPLQNGSDYDAGVLLQRRTHPRVGPFTWGVDIRWIRRISPRFRYEFTLEVKGAIVTRRGRV